MKSVRKPEYDSPSANKYTVTYTTQNNDARKRFTSYSVVAHAGGALELPGGKKAKYTNSQEAVVQNYERGYRAFEIDFNFTSDGSLVAIHEWIDSKRLTGLSEKPTLSEWKSRKILGEYTTMSLDDVLSLMGRYADIILVTDTKHTDQANVKMAFTQIVERADHIEPSILSRIVPQIYNQHMLEWIDEVYEFDDVIYTLYKSKQTTAQVLKYVESEKRIIAVTMWGSRALGEKGLVKQLNKLGIPVYAHTVNSEQTSRDLRNVGVHGIYTDTLTDF